MCILSIELLIGDNIVSSIISVTSGLHRSYINSINTLISSNNNVTVII